MSYQSDLNRAAGLITGLIKSTIQNKGLVDTGKLLNSISTTVSINSETGAFQIKVSGEDYFEYLDNKFNIVDDAFASSAFASIEEILNTAYMSFLEDKINTDQIKN